MVFGVIWLVLAPVYVLSKNASCFFVDYLGLLLKVALLIDIKFYMNVSQFYALVGGFLVIVLQFLVFLAFKNTDPTPHVILKV